MLLFFIIFICAGGGIEPRLWNVKDLNSSKSPEMLEKHSIIYLYTCCGKQPRGLVAKNIAQKWQ